MKLLSPANVLEWGPGKSTEIILSYQCVKRLISMEHQSQYYEKAKTYFNDYRLDLNFTENMEWYVKHPKTLGFKFDLILIDGREREKCTILSQELLSDTGVVIVHDAQREHYRSFIDLFPVQDWDKPAGREWTVVLRGHSEN